MYEQLPIYSCIRCIYRNQREILRQLFSCKYCKILKNIRERLLLPLLFQNYLGIVSKFCFQGAVHMKIVFPLFSRLTWRKIFSRVHIRNIFPPGRELFCRLLGGKLCEKAIFKLGDTNLKEKVSVLLWLNISGLDTLILFLVGVLHLLDTQRQHRTFFISSLLTSSQKNNSLKFLVNKNDYVIFFCTCFVGKNYLTQPGKCVHMRKYFLA